MCPLLRLGHKELCPPRRTEADRLWHFFLTQEDGVRLELLGTADYAAIVEALAKHLQLSSPALLRLTQHSAWSVAGPSKRQYKWMEEGITLDKMLPAGAASPQVVYYEVHTGSHSARCKMPAWAISSSSRHVRSALKDDESCRHLRRCWTCRWRSLSR